MRTLALTIKAHDMLDIVEVRTRFYDYYFYSKDVFKKDYMSEVNTFDLAVWDAPQRAARLSALVKNYKTSAMLVFILSIAQELELDFTPLVVKRLNKEFFGRTGSQRIIVDLFGEKGRTNKSKDSKMEQIEVVATEYRVKAELHMKQCLSDIQKIKNSYGSAVSADQLSRSRSK